MRRTVAATALLGTTVLVLAACSSGSAAPADDSATSGEISWWGWTPAEKVIADSYIAEFNKDFPDIEVTFKQLGLGDYQAIMRPALASNEGPDVFNIAPGVLFGQFSQFGIDLTPAMEETLGADWKDLLVPAAIEPLTDSEGELKAAAVGFVYAGPLWINKDLFDEYGLTPPTTIDEWIDVCAEFQSHDVGCFVHGAQDEGFNRDMFQAIADTINPGLFVRAAAGEAEWTDPDLVEAMEIWKSLFDDGVMQPGALGTRHYPDANNEFLAQKYAMIQMGQWYGQYATESVMIPAIQGAGVADAQTFTVLPIPFPVASATGTSGSLFGAADYGLAVNAKSKSKNAATTFALWLATSENGQQMVANALNNIPALKSAEIDWDAAGLVNPEVQKEPIEALIALAKQSTEGRGLEADPQIITSVSQAATSVAEGQATPEEAMQTLQTQLQG